MKKEQVLELMSALDPGLVEEAALQAPAGRRIPRLARAGLIAACLCLVLVGTGVAAVVNGWIQVSDIRFYPTTHVNGTKSSYAEVKVDSDQGPAYIPFDQFSQEARDFPHSSTYLPQYKSFDTWDAAEEFLGIEIADNPVLDQMEPIPHPLEDSQYGIKMDPANCFVMFYGQMDTPTIRMSMTYRPTRDDLRDFQLVVFAAIITDEPSPEGQTGAGAAVFQNHEMPETETYTTPSGLQAVIVTAKTDPAPDSMISSQTIFRLNGAKFTLLASHNDKDELLRIIKEVLDAYS